MYIYIYIYIHISTYLYVELYIVPRPAMPELACTPIEARDASAARRPARIGFVSLHSWTDSSKTGAASRELRGPCHGRIDGRLRVFERVDARMTAQA